MAFWFFKSKPDDADIIIKGVPLDATATFLPGTRLAADRIRTCSETVESYSPYFKKDIADLRICDSGDLNLKGLPSMKAKLDKIAETVSDILVTNRKPLLIGGEHTLSLGGVQAAVHKHPDLKVVQLDAHADLRDVGEGGSRFSHDTVMRRVRKLLAPDSLIQVGIRSFAAEELQTRKTRFFKISETKEVDKIVNGQPVWLTFDIDVLDPSVMPAVGTPEPNGASYQEIIEFLLALRTVNLVGVDLVEFNPLAADFIAPCVVAANLIRELCCLLSC